MRKFFFNFLATIVILVWFAPLIAALADILSWILIQRAITKIDWTVSRVGVSALWTILGAVVAIPSSMGLFEEAEKS